MHNPLTGKPTVDVLSLALRLRPLFGLPLPPPPAAGVAGAVAVAAAAAVAAEAAQFEFVLLGEAAYGSAYAPLYQLDRFLASASRVLWLAHHGADDWDHLRAQPDMWLQQIEAWSDKFINADEIIQAVKLAHLLRTEHLKFVTLPRPEKRTPGVDAGN